MMVTALGWEKAYPYLLAAGGTLLFVWLGAPFPKAAEPLLGASGTMAAVLVGFLATAKAIMLGLNKTDIHAQMKTAGYFGLLVRYLAEAVASGVLFLVFSVLGFFVASDSVAPHAYGYRVFWMLLALVAILTYARLIHLLFKTLTKL